MGRGSMEGHSDQAIQGFGLVNNTESLVSEVTYSHSGSTKLPVSHEAEQKSSGTVLIRERPPARSQKASHDMKETEDTEIGHDGHGASQPAIKKKKERQRVGRYNRDVMKWNP